MYSTWAERRRKRVLFWLGLIGFVAIATYVTISLYEPPSCFDNKKNQDEVGVDCGGICAPLCPWQVNDLRTDWARSFKVSDDLWNAVAYIENPNPSAYVLEAPYRFTLYNKANKVIAEREDTTFITPGIIMPVFGKRIETNGEVPYRTEFEWTGDSMVWLQMKKATQVTIEEQRLMNVNHKPQLNAVVANEMPYYVENIEVVAIIFDVNKNAIATSKTFIDSLPPRSKQPIVFSWLEPFPAQPERWEVIARVPNQED